MTVKVVDATDRLNEWKVADAKNKFSELLDRAENDGPQYVTRRGQQFQVQLVREGDEEENQLVRAFLDEPEFGDINIDRIDAPMKEPEW